MNARKNAVDQSDLSVGLAVGAGGPTGGPFIDAALAVLEARTGWTAASAAQIVGTSAGAFVAARVGPAEDPNPDAIQQLISLGNGSGMRATVGTKFIRELRLVGGRALALLAPPDREKALYDVPSGPYHRGAGVVTVEHTWGVRHFHNLADNHGHAESLVRASAAIPYKNGPIDVFGQLHADGAVHSANNVDLVDPEQCPIIVVISPMIPATGGKVVSNFHRSQLIEELRPWSEPGRVAVVVMPSEDEHANRRDRNSFKEAGARAAERLFA